MDFEELRKKRDELNAETRKLIDEKMKLVQASKDVLTEINECKKTRDEKNDKVREAKDKRKKILDEANVCRKELDGILSKLDSFKSSASDSYAFLKKEFDQLNWEYQTGVQSRTKEKELVKEMDALEAQLQKHTEARDIRKKVHGLQAKMKELFTEANVYHNLVLAYAKESEEHHKKMFELYGKTDDCRKKIKELDSKIDSAKKDADFSHQQLMGELKKEKAEFHEPAKIDETEYKKKAEKILIDFRNGKKITVEELGLLERYGLY